MRCWKSARARYLTTPELPDRPRHLRELPWAARARRGVEFVDGVTVRERRPRRRRGGAQRALRTRRHGAGDRGPLGRGCVRPGGHPEAPTRPGARQRPRRQQRVVPHRRAHRRQRVVERPAVARALQPAESLALHEPPGRRGLLGVADPARVGLAFGRHRRGRPHPPAASASTATGERSSGCASSSRGWRRTSRPSASCCRISSSSSTSRTAAGRSSRASAGR